MDTQVHRKKKLPCQYFLSGTCSFESGDACAFSHDRETCLPGVLKDNCLHFIQGYCRNGKFCLNVHDTEAREAHQKKREARMRMNPLESRVKPVIRSYSGLEVAPEKYPSPTIPETLIHNNPDKLVMLPRNNMVKEPGAEQPQHFEEYAEDHVTSLEQYNAALKSTDELYYFGSSPSFDVQNGSAYKAPEKPLDWSNLVSTIPREVKQQSTKFMNQKNSGNLYDRPGVLHETPMPVCKFFLQNSCVNGSKCRFSHTPDPPFRLPVEMEKFERSASQDLVCGICRETVVNIPKNRFGILSGCDHAFCLRCIKNWRTSDMAHKDDKKELVRRCPLCRHPSYFIIPCDRMVRDPSRKAALIGEYKIAMSNTHCTYFSRGHGDCPFGSSCFYKHVYENGEEQDPGDTFRTYKDSVGKTQIEKAVKLSAYFDHMIKRRR